jgi:hypothetical protein
LVGITLYRMLDLVDDVDDSGHRAPVVAAAAAPPPSKPLKSSGEKFYPPPPPPLPGRAAVARPSRPQGREIVVLDVPVARDSAALSAPADLTAPVLESRLDPVAQAAIAEPLADVPSAPAPQRNNRFVRAFHRVARFIKPN